ncbi:hypothetical protein BDQ12DRAFT_436340 [Crucibulum laeve]|uniref:Uncharacterized protein n=1 Tax=Crucibulum laeve TaxID=68775 RepID=A0A5C3M7U5_9AGAR|nr:hypothetical protein BDQ12DRAFT_436340 [Crucibulum laeve]
MANSDKAPQLVEQLTSKEEKETAVKEGGRREDGEGAGSNGPTEGMSATPFVAVADPSAKTTSTSMSSQSSTSSTRPSLVQLSTSNAPGSSTTTPAAPHPKKFSAVNINKKFLEKNYSASGSTPAASTSSVAKAGSPVSRPTVQSSTSHSRLVAAKLTATPSVSSSTAGWSRPSSVAPSPAATGPSTPSASSPLPSAATVATTALVSPQLPHVGKVIQPQPRSVGLQQTTSQKDLPPGKAANKPAWGHVKPPAVAPSVSLTSDDFPTAAEVAKVTASARKQKAEEVKPPPTPTETAAAASKQARMEDADTFRGVHLDPNAHHWDEDEEDDDNFLGGVIEFGDGRQYKIETTSEPSPPQIQSRAGDLLPSKDSASGPVSKEERFVDDFDRSWPKSRGSPATSSRDVPPASATTSSPSSSTQALHSPQDSSRVLFNERSNRLEPYSQGQRPPPPGQHPPKRNSFQDSNNVQLLQKPGLSDFPPRPRGFSGGRGGFGGGSYSGDRDHQYRRDGPPPSPRMNRDFPPHAMAPSASLSGRDRDQDRGRRNAMGPPPLPAHAMRRPSIEGGRQLPPHLSQASPNIPVRRLPSRDSKFPEPPSAGVSAPVQHPSHSPALSHASAVIISPIAAPSAALPGLAGADLDEARKDVMQTAAARAKQRRQQEEEEREAQKERARRKAAELEEKMKSTETEKQKQKGAEEMQKVVDEASKAVEESRKAKQAVADAEEKEVIAVIEDAVKSVAPSAHSTLPGKPSLQRPPSAKGAQRPTPDQDATRPGVMRRPSALTPRAGPSTAPAPSPAMQTESWRAKASPLPPPPPFATRQTLAQTSTPAFMPPPPSALEHVGAMSQDAADDLEVVDFSDMDKFMGVPEALEQITEKPGRPVASDFFDEKPQAEIYQPAKSDSVWRRKSVQEEPAPTPANEAGEIMKDTPIQDTSIASQEHPRPEDTSGASVSSETSRDNVDVEHHGQTVNVPPHLGVAQRTPRGQNFYKEATMSALDDAMSRIKGALNASKESHPGAPPTDTEATPSRHALPQAKQAPPKERWVPPALRPRNVEFPQHPDEHEELEVFDLTGTEPPRSPKPAWNSFTVRLPKVSQHREFVGKRQLQSFFRPPQPVRWDILSFEPSVEGMNKRDLSLNDVLFRKQPGGYKAKPKYRVVLPRFRYFSSGPRVNIPTAATGSRTNGAGAFGRPTVADGASTWRKPLVSPPKELDEHSPHILDTTSRSPPPEVSGSQTGIAFIPKSLDSPTKSDSTQASSRGRTVPKMPAGSAVAVYRDSRIDVIEDNPKALVNFIVTSELEDSKQSSRVANLDAASTDVPSSDTGKPVVNGVAPTEDKVPSLLPEKAESKSSDDSSDQVLVTPPGHHAAAWARSSLSLPLKESPARGPDPEHLKALWSQNTDKAGFHPINSLKGIADDLTALPFTIQDVKSEDGETPPPSIPSVPSRMSAHEVTRAFQTVPSSSSSTTSSHRTPLSPPLTNAPVARPPTTYAYSPMSANNMRPAYASYPSPMMSHSPAPPVMYPHPMNSSPVPSRMPVNGHTPLYSQPMWMTMTGPSQNPGNMMRPMPSPYPAQLMSYPSPGTPMYGLPPPGNIQPNHQPNSVQANRGRGIPVMNPVMQHAGSPMYAGSPVLMHAPVMQVPQNHGYMPMPAGRGQGQVRPENGQMASPYTRPTW